MKILYVEKTYNEFLLSSHFTTGESTYFQIYDNKDVFGKLKGVLEYNIEKESNVGRINFNEEISIIDKNTGQNIFYYISHQKTTDHITLYINQVCYETMSSKRVYKFTLLHNDINNLENLLMNRTELFGISERYFVFALPQFDSDKLDYNDSNKYLLVDIIEEQIYKIPKMIGSNDSFDNLSYLNTFNIVDRSYVVITTGRISALEKKELWENHRSAMLPHSKVQSVAIIPLNTFTEEIKSNKCIDNQYIVQKYDADSALVQLEIINSKLYLYNENFSNTSSELLIFDLIDDRRKLETIEVQCLYRKIFNIGNRPLYGLIKVKEANELYDIHELSLLFHSNKGTDVYWVYKNILITREYNSKESLVTLKVIDMNTQNVIAQQKGDIPGFDYVAESEALLLF
ncbi:hypothetical protein D3C74_79260 [compost metagenome]